MDKLKVLLIDDELDFLEVMGRRIENWGYGVLKAASGKEGVDLLKNDTPDIVILDYMMPDMDGIETLREIRKVDKKIPVIMFTAHPDVKGIQGSEKLGVSAFIAKLSVYSDAHFALKSTMDMVRKRLEKQK